MAADGRIEIETAIDTDGFKIGVKEMEEAARHMSRSVSKIGATAEEAAKQQMQSFSSASKQYDDQIEKAEKLNSELEKLNKNKQDIKITRWNDNTENSDYDGPLLPPTTVSEKNLGYSKETAEKIEEVGKSAEDSERQVNELYQSIEELKQSIKTMESNGKWWGDEEYDQAAVNLERMKQAAKDYKSELMSPVPNENPFGLDTLAGKIKAAEIELRKCIEAGKGLGDTKYDRAYQKLAALNAEAKEYRKNLTDTAGAKEIKRTSGYFGEAGKKIRGLTKYLKEAVKFLGRMKKNAKSLGNSIKKAGTAIKDFAGFGKDAQKSTNGLSKSIKTLLKYGIGIRSLFVLFNKIRNFRNIYF